MLAKVVVLPAALGAGVGSLPSIETIMIQDLEEAGQLLIDESVWSSYDSHIDSWPPRLRTEAKKRLSAMKQRGRVVTFELARHQTVVVAYPSRRSAKDECRIHLLQRRVLRSRQGVERDDTRPRLRHQPIPRVGFSQE